jgi:hypothetical protein
VYLVFEAGLLVGLDAGPAEMQHNITTIAAITLRMTFSGIISSSLF